MSAAPPPRQDAAARRPADQGPRPQGRHQGRAVHRRARSPVRARRPVHPAGAHVSPWHGKTLELVRIALVQRPPGRLLRGRGRPHRGRGAGPGDPLDRPGPEAAVRPKKTPGTTTSSSGSRVCATASGRPCRRASTTSRPRTCSSSHDRRPRGPRPVRQGDRPRRRRRRRHRHGDAPRRPLRGPPDAEPERRRLTSRPAQTRPADSAHRLGAGIASISSKDTATRTRAR